MKYFIESLVLSMQFDSDRVMFASESFVKCQAKVLEFMEKYKMKQNCFRIDVTTHPIRTGSKIKGK